MNLDAIVYRMSPLSPFDDDTDDVSHDQVPDPARPTTAKRLTGDRLRSQAFALLAQREWSAGRLKARLVALGGDAAEVDDLVQEFQDNHYQSDERMAGMLLRSQLQKGRGPRRIRQTLQEHRVNADLIQEELQETDWLAQARQLRTRKFGTDLPTDAKEKARQLRFLQYRGFDLSVCLAALQPYED